MTRAERKQQGPGMGEGRFQRSNHRRLLEAWPHLGPGPSTRRAAQSLLPRRVPGSGAPHNPSQGCEVRTAHSAGGLCPAFFRIFVVVVVGGSVGWGAGKRGSPHEEAARRAPQPGAGRPSRFRARAQGPSRHVAARHALGGRAARRSPGGRPEGRAAAAPRAMSSPGPAPPPGRELGCGSREPPSAGRPRPRGASCRPYASRSRTHQAFGPRGRETEAGEAGTRLSHGAGQWRAASNAGSRLTPLAGRELSHPHLQAMETPSPPLAPSRPPLPAPPTPPAEPSLSRPRPGASSGRAPTQPSRPDVASWPPNWAPGVARFLLLGLPTSACTTLAGLQPTRNPRALPAFSPR